jgi:hypothetical protein
MELFDFLPAGHDAGSSSEADTLPHGVEVAVVDNTDVVCFVGEGGHLVAFEVVVMVSHGVGEAADDGSGNI